MLFRNQPESVFYILDFKLRHESELSEIYRQNGDTVGRRYFSRHKSCSVPAEHGNQVNPAYDFQQLFGIFQQNAVQAAFFRRLDKGVVNGIVENFNYIFYSRNQHFYLA